jgi:hypothetical protein
MWCYFERDKSPSGSVLKTFYLGWWFPVFSVWPMWSAEGRIQSKPVGTRDLEDLWGAPVGALTFPSPKQPGQARPRLRKPSCHPPPSERSRGRLPSPSLFGKRAAPPAREPGTRLRAPRPQPAPSPPARALTSARAGSRPCTAAGCGCSCWAGAGGSWFRWLRSSSGPARTPAGAQSNWSSKSTSSLRVGARPLPRAAAAIPPAQPAPRCGRKKCRRREASSPACRQAPPSGLAAAQGAALQHAGRGDRTGTDRRRELRSSWAAEATHSSNCLRGPTPPARPLANTTSHWPDVSPASWRFRQVEVRLAHWSYWTRRAGPGSWSCLMDSPCVLSGPTRDPLIGPGEVRLPGSYQYFLKSLRSLRPKPPPPPLLLNVKWVPAPLPTWQELPHL